MRERCENQERLIAEGFRRHNGLQAECLVVHVQEPDDSDDASRECVRSLAQQAEERKAEFMNLPRRRCGGGASGMRAPVPERDQTGPWARNPAVASSLASQVLRANLRARTLNWDLLSL